MRRTSPRAWISLLAVITLAPLAGACRRSSCDSSALQAAADRIEQAQARWSSTEGTLPTRREDAIAAIWQSCSGLPEGAKKLLDQAYEHPVAPWVLQGQPTPADPDDPLAAILPGHLDVHTGTALTKPSPSLKEWMWAGCDDPDAVQAAMADADNAGRLVPFLERCVADPRPVTREELAERFVATGPIGLSAHHWLTKNAKADEPVARTLTRAIVLDGRWFEYATPSLRFPHADRASTDTAGLQIQVTPEGVTQGMHRVVNFDPSGRPSSESDLDEAGTYRDLHATLESEAERQRRFLEEGASWAGRVVLAGHRDQPWSSVRPALGAAMHYGYSAALVVLVDEPLAPLQTLALHDEGAPVPAAATLTVGADGSTIRCGNEGPPQPLTGSLPACVGAGATVEVSVGDAATVQGLVDALGRLGEHPRRITG